MSKKNTNTNLDKIRNLTLKLRPLDRDAIMDIEESDLFKKIIKPVLERSNSKGDNDLS